jgi:uncharacterized membrane protein (DUF106 family)
MEELNKELENQILELGNLLNQKDRDMQELKGIIKDLQQENKELKEQNHDFNVIVRKLNGLEKSIMEYIGKE